MGAYAMFLSDVGVCAIGERSGMAEGDRVPSGGSFVRSLLNGVGVAAVPSPATEGVFDDLLRCLLFGGFSARRLASASAICRLTMSPVFSPAMMDTDDVGTGVQGRDGNLDSCAFREQLGG